MKTLDLKKILFSLFSLQNLAPFALWVMFKLKILKDYWPNDLSEFLIGKKLEKKSFIKIISQKVVTAMLKTNK